MDDPSRTTWGPVTISAGGVTLTAKVQSVTWDMGDGTTLTCGKGTEWQRGMGDRTALEVSDWLDGTGDGPLDLSQRADAILRAHRWLERKDRVS